MHTWKEFFKKIWNYKFIPEIFFIIVVVLSRAQTFGNPILNIDEDFYLFSGGRILQGDLPYVDFWDRKPIFLFLLYSVFHLFGTYRVIAYQVGASLAVWATCLSLYYMARTLTSRGGALLASAMYATGLTLCGGEGGQAPVFYTLLVTAAIALVLFKIVLNPSGLKEARRTGALAMMLFGISMQIKYTTLFEGVYLGIFLIVYEFYNKVNVKKIFFNSFVWIASAISPTFLAFLFYTSIGHAHAWLFSNVYSIFLRSPLPDLDRINLQIRLLKIITPILAGSVVAFFLTRQDPRKPQRIFIGGWAVAACSGVLLFGSRYPHYLLPLFAPLSLVNSLFWNLTVGRYWLIFLLSINIIKGQTHIHHSIQKNGDYQAYRSILMSMPNPKGCLFIYDGSTALYDTAHWCHLTTHPFPAHFNELSEVNSTGMNPYTELGHVLSQKPEYIMIQDPPWGGDNQMLRSRLLRTLAKNYKEIYRYGALEVSIIIYQRIPTKNTQIP